ncbi:MAG TPA: Gfo/Idh/MocA family oxidoreductase [Streptosporangiaceae bacterium]|nr:Gfo/Idh/MocA family oxidoreductase [Streptosporangiaceae bacterium]
MKSVVQPPNGGAVQVLDVPRPAAAPTEVLVRTIASVISPGTERAVTPLAQSSLLARARARPDLVRRVVRQARTEGIVTAAHAARGRLAGDLPLGYSAAGQVVEVGSAVSGLRAGQLVATGGAGKASHAEFQAVPGLLCAVVPDGVPAEDAAFATVAAIALHGLRLAEAGPGSKVVVIGLGLVGQLAARLAMVSGCDVVGIDPVPHARIVATGSGVLALDELGDATTDQVVAWSRGRGADAVLICAASPASAPVTRAPALCRDRAAVVIVGDVGLELDRAPLYERELSLRFARSYGPGRYDPSYEAWGVDYPAGQVRWTEGRNFEAVLDLLAAGRLRVSDLVTHRFGIGDAAAAYELIERRADPYLAIQLTYQPTPAADDRIMFRPPAHSPAPPPLALPAPGSSPGVGWVGAGTFSTQTLMPAFRRAGFKHFVAVTSASGISARRAAERHNFEKALSRAFPVIDDPAVGIVVIATPHNTHAELATLALKDGRHVWCEKPLALTLDELGEVEAAWQASGRQLMIGFNRRWSPALAAAKRALARVPAPRFLVYRVAAGPVPEGHRYTDRRQGGRLLGEVCHFVDAAQALVGADIAETVSVLAGDGHGGPRASSGSLVPGNDAVVSLRFADGSLATICYGSALPTAGKEWIEITAGERRLVIDDFRSVKQDGQTLWRGRQDKGHNASATAFWKSVTGGPPLPTETMLATMRATIQAADIGGSCGWAGNAAS